MPEKTKVSKAQQKAVHKYVKNNYDRIELTVKPKGKKEELKAHAEKKGETLNSFINRAIKETMERDNAKLALPSTPNELEREQNASAACSVLYYLSNFAIFAFYSRSW